jgi:hypothetical protein
VAGVGGWQDLHKVDPFRHRWLPQSSRSALIVIWTFFFVLPLGVILVIGWLDESYYL